MVSLETLHQDPSKNITTESSSNSSPRISFSADFLPINTPPIIENDAVNERSNKSQFEFLSGGANAAEDMTTADELFHDGKLLPFWQKHYADKLNEVVALKGENSTVNVVDQGGPPPKSEVVAAPEQKNSKEEPRMSSWFLEDDPSPRPPTCTVLWKELLRLRKHRASTTTTTLSPSSSSSSSSSSRSSLGDLIPSSSDEKNGDGKEKSVKRVYKKGLERTKSATFRIRPVINVPICTQTKNSSALPPLFSLKKGKSR